MITASIWESAISSKRLSTRQHWRNRGQLLSPGFCHSGNNILSMHTRPLLFSALFLLSVANVMARGVYQSAEDFLNEVYRGKVPKPAVVWLTGEKKEKTEAILGHPYSSLRIRYWRQGDRSAWILDEIGKDLPVTVGLVIDNGHLDTIKVLTFRESRGWEIRHAFFTDQFKDASLNGNQKLDRNIDGISGATLSVRAMKKLATLALYLDSTIKTGDVQATP